MTQLLPALTVPVVGAIAILVEEVVVVIQAGRAAPSVSTTAVKVPVVAQVVLSTVHLRMDGPEV